MVAFTLVDGFNHTNNFAVCNHGYTKQIACAVSHSVVYAFEPAWFVAGIFHQHGLTMLSYPTRQAALLGHHNGLHSANAHLRRRLEAQFSGALVDKQNGGTLGIRQFCSGLDNAVEQGPQIENGVKLLANLHQALVARHQLEIVAYRNLVYRRLLRVHNSKVPPEYLRFEQE